MAKTCELAKLAVAVMMEEPEMPTGWSTTDELLDPPAILMGDPLIVATLLLLLVTVADTEVPPATAWVSMKAPPETRPVSMVKLAAPEETEALKLPAPGPPGEVMRNPAWSMLTVPLAVENPGACAV